MWCFCFGSADALRFFVARQETKRGEAIPLQRHITLLHAYGFRKSCVRRAKRTSLVHFVILVQRVILASHQSFAISGQRFMPLFCCWSLHGVNFPIHKRTSKQIRNCLRKNVKRHYGGRLVLEPRLKAVVVAPNGGVAHPRRALRHRGGFNYASIWRVAVHQQLKYVNRKCEVVRFRKGAAWADTCKSPQARV